MPLAVWLTLAVSAGPPIDAGRLDALARQSMRAWGVPGVAAVAVRGDRVVYLRGHGRRHAGRPAPVTPDTLFPLGSCSKSFTSALIAYLAGQRRLKFDDHVRAHLPNFRLSDPVADAAVTLRDLMCHRTGLGTHDLLWYRVPWGVRESVRRAGRLRPDYPFRSGFAYQSVMVSAAGLAAASAAGRPWDELVEGRLLRPLGMARTGCRTGPALADADRAAGHRRDGGQLEAVPWYRMAEPNPAGSVHSCARDVGRWLRFHLNRGELDGRRLISAASLGETHSPQNIIPLKGLVREVNPETAQLGYGMGWVVRDYRGVREVGHGGAIDGFRCSFALYPDRGVGVAVLANLEGSRMTFALVHKLADELLDLPPRDWDAYFLKIDRRQLAEKERSYREWLGRRQGGTRRPAAADLAGVYRHPAYGDAVIECDNGRLRWRWGTFAAGLSHFHFNVYRIGLKRFRRDPVEFRFGPGGVESLRMFGLTFRPEENSLPQGTQRKGNKGLSS